ncbi:MAG: DHA2 family efflux MFS transporter permease subunit [Aestuariivirga sp.]|nr:DHA2 family efflux MFS transporter permease subunit [Aestuariivirga sp.]MCA3561061.1 DHA2 family efflux MFS transporter permease subunit [Aestuariivirga sp.]
MRAGAPPAGAAPLRVWLGFAAMSLGMFMAVLDIQIVVTSLPAIQQALGIDADLMSWVQTSYLIAEVIAIPLTGILTRIFSLKYVFALAIGGFTLASIGCALSGGFASLIFMRVLQGFCGGLLIPLVFSAVFTLFKPGLEQAIATSVAGVLAILAPAFGPIGGGYITHHLSWHWLFLVNVLPGIASLGAGLLTLPAAERQMGLLRRLDWLSLAAIGGGLAALEIGLKNAPDNGWLSVKVLALLAAAAVLIGAATRRRNPVVEFRLLRDRTLAYGCAASFLLGASLYGAGYIMPVFLAFVRRHDPLEIGGIVLVTGLTQLLTAPIAVLLDRYLPPRPLAAIGFAGLAVGVAMSAFQDVNTDYDQMFWPQVVRGCFMALCMLPLTRLSLGPIPLGQVSDASGLYNLSRNLGGAIGIALADTVIFGRAADYADKIADLVRSGAPEAAQLLGMLPDDVPAPDDAVGMMSIMDAIQDAGVTLAINDAWLMFSVITAAAIPLLWMMGPVRKNPHRN